MTQTTDSGPAWNRSGGRSTTAPGSPAPAQAGDRLPVPTRQRRPAFAALALVLILGGAAVSGLLVLRGNQRVSVLMVRSELEPGHVFEATDFRETQLSYTSDVQPVRFAQLNSLIGGKYRANGRIPAGALLTYGMVTNKIEVPGTNFVSVGVAVPAGQYPDGIRGGDAVKVLFTPKSAIGTNTSLSSLVSGATLIDEAFVKSATQVAGSGGSILQLTLVVPNANLTRVTRQGLPLIAAANAINAVSVAKLPDSTQAATGANQ